jgi:hypothetical protein
MDNESCLHMPPVPRNIQETTKLKRKHCQFPVLVNDKLSPKIEAKIFLKCGRFLVANLKHDDLLFSSCWSLPPHLSRKEEIDDGICFL